MVNLDMVPRHLRPVPVLIAVLAAITLAAPYSAPATDAASANGDQHAAVATAKIAPRTVADRAPRPAPPLVPVAVLSGGLASIALLLTRYDRLIGRRLRRVHDAGHDWRSLLLGAPPALA